MHKSQKRHNYLLDWKLLFNTLIIPIWYIKRTILSTEAQYSNHKSTNYKAGAELLTAYCTSLTTVRGSRMVKV